MHALHTLEDERDQFFNNYASQIESMYFEEKPESTMNSVTCKTSEMAAHEDSNPVSERSVPNEELETKSHSTHKNEESKSAHITVDVEESKEEEFSLDSKLVPAHSEDYKYLS